MDASPALEAIDLQHRYHDEPALERISLHLFSGETLALLGPNGAGKSTLLNILSGILAPTAGEVKIAGTALRERPALRRRIGYLPARPPLHDDLSAREQLAFAAHLYGLDQATRRIDEIIDRCRLGAVQGQRNGWLSKGFRQRVALAQALLHEPEILLLDEPGDGLDPLQRQAFHQLLKDLQPDTAIVLSSHQLAEAKSLCDRLLILDAGRALLAASMSEIDEPLERLFTRLIYGGDDDV